MRNHVAFRWLLAAAISIFGTTAFAQNAVRISEFHYDNAGADVGEAVEVSAPAGTDLTGWQVVLYNGANGASYGALNLTGIVPATCGTRGVVVVNGPSSGIQNGSPDGLALVNAGGTLVEFLSYEGSFAGVGGAANAVTSFDIGVFEAGTEDTGWSLSRSPSGMWDSPAPNTFGACNDGGTQPPAGTVASVTLDPSENTVTVDSSFMISAVAFDSANQELPDEAFTWSSSNTAVATVDEAGSVHALAAGNATITATASNGVTGTALVHVTGSASTSTDFHFNEIHYDNLSTDAGEAIEIEGPAGADVTGFTIVLYNGNGFAPYGTPQVLSGLIPATCGDRGVLVVNYPQDGIQNGSPDGMALVNAQGTVIEFRSYEGVFTAVGGPANGMLSIDIGASETNAPVGTSLQRDSANVWAAGTSSFGACNATAPPPASNTISITGRTASDPALPVGYEDQLFATLRSPSNVTIPTTITWSSDTLDIATIDAAGVIHAVAAGSAVLRATAADGTTSTITLPTRVAVASGVAYPGNAEFGEPADSDASDDFVVHHEQFVASYNPNRGGPNWVSYDLDAAHFGAEDRCDCFTMDPDLPASFPRITTDDYTGSGAIAGYGIDRGHMTRSFDRTTGSLDNARTYLFSNVVPQAAEVNQGPWANLENYLGDLARTQDKEVYIITGPAGNKGTLKNLGRVVIPTSTWKVAVIMAHDQGLANVHDYRDLEVIAVNMPNDPSVPGGPDVRNSDWNSYRTTVDAIEALTGYDLLALLPDKVEAAVESNTKPPLAAVAGPAGSIAEGDSATFDASSSIDPNGTIASYSWDFGDGSTGTGVSVSHTFAQDGQFTVRVTVTDNDGLTDTATFSLTVNNVAPVVSSVPNATLEVGQTYNATGTFTDPGADAWTATVHWGDGSAPEVVALASRNFSLTHIYTSGGTYTVTIDVADDDASVSTSNTVTVTVPVPESGLADAIPLINNLVATGKIPRSIGVLWKAEVIAAQVLIGRGNESAAIQVLQLEIAQIDALVHCHVVKAADVAPLRKILVDAVATLEAAAPKVRRYRH